MPESTGRLRQRVSDLHASKLNSLRTPRAVVIGLLCLFLAVWFGTLDEREFFNPDEGRYAEIPREMLTTGDWITPRLNGLKYFEKPVLQYWITAASYWVFGEEEWVARLWPAVSGLLTLLLVYYTGRRLAGVRIGVTAAALLASSFQFFMFSQILTLDMGLTFFLTLVLSAFIASQDRRAKATQRRNYAILTWVAMALAVLSKGLIGAVLPTLVLAAYILIQRDWKLLGRLHWGWGIPVFLLVVAPWFVAVQLRNPEFFRFFFVHEHFGRFALGEHHRPGAWYYFVGVLLIGSLPWSWAYIRATLGAWRTPALKDFDVDPIRLLVIWVVVITLFFSLSTSKLPGYILPVYPALALLLGREAVCNWLSTRYLLGMFASGIFIVIAAPFVTYVPKFAADADLIVPYVPWVVASGCTLAAGALLALLMLRRYRLFALSAVGFGTLLSFQALLTGTESIEDQFSSENLVETVLDKIGDFDAEAPFYSLDMYDQSLPHHLGRTVTVVSYQGELALGIKQEPERIVATIEEFRQRWQAREQGYAIMTQERYGKEQTVRTPMSLLASNRKAVIVARAASSEANKKPRRPDR